MFVNSKVLIAVLVVLVCSPVDAILKPTKSTLDLVINR